MEVVLSKRYETNGGGVEFKFRITAKEPCEINVILFDGDFLNTEYYKKKDVATSPNEIFDYKITVPKTFDFTRLIIFANGNVFVSEIKATEFKRSFILSKQDAEFVELIEKFAYNAGFCPAGVYHSKNGNFTINYVNGLLTENGRSVQTPSRIDIKTNIIDFSQEKTRNLTISRRVAIGLHEYSHNFKNKNPDSEIEADTNAWKIYKELGYPRIEFIKTWCDVFNGSLPKEVFLPSQKQQEQSYRDRILNIYNLIK